jgi:hypothetical protein
MVKSQKKFKKCETLTLFLKNNNKIFSGLWFLSKTLLDVRLMSTKFFQNFIKDFEEVSR